MPSYSDWYNIALSSGASGLSNITDATYPGDPQGTDSNSSYWNARAYDQLASIFTQLGMNPSGGVNGNFTVNIDATSNQSSSLYFGTAGTVGGADPSLSWNAGLTSFVFSHPIIISGAQNIGSSSLRAGSFYATNIDATGYLTLGGDLTVSGSTQLENVTVLGQLVAASLNIDTNLTIDGSILTLLDSHTGPPTLSAAVSVNRGDNTDAQLRWYETGVDNTSKWQAYNIGSAAYEDLALLNSSGFTNDNVFESSGGYFGISNYAARSDHNHSGATLAATGTDETSFTLDSDWTSGPSNIELRFADSTNYIRYNPGEGSPRFIFSDEVDTPLLTAASANITGDLTLSGAITDNLDIDGSVITLEADNIGGYFDSNVDIRVNLGIGGNRNIRWDGDTGSPDGGQWKFTNDGTNYYNLIGTDATGNITLSGAIDGALNTTSNYITLRSGTLTDDDGGLTVTRSAGNVTIEWSETSGNWQFIDTTGTYDLVGSNKSQVLINKTLSLPTITTPTVSNGTFSGSPVFTGTPSFSGSPSFSNAPSFSAAASDPVFSVSNNVKITNLNADYVDGKTVDDTLTSNAYLWTADKIITYVASQVPSELTPDPHQADHQAGGSDALTGTLSITGTDSDTFTVGTGAAEPATLSLGNTGLYQIEILSNTSKTMGIGGAGVSVQPSSTGQTLGSLSNRWDIGFFGKYINVDPILSASYPSANGSIWFKQPEFSQANYTLSVRMNSTTFDVLHSDGKLGTSVTGATGIWNMPSGMTTGSSSLVTDLNADSVDGHHVSDIGVLNELWTASKIISYVGGLNQWSLKTTSTVTIEPNYTVEFAAGSGLTRSYFPDAGNLHTVTYSHATPASVAVDVNNTGTTFIQGITFDGFGHVASTSSSNPFTAQPAFNPSTNIPPFTTNSDIVVVNLNADKVDGKDVGSSDTQLWIGSAIKTYADNHTIGVTGGSSGLFLSGNTLEIAGGDGIDATYGFNGISNTQTITIDHSIPSSVASDVSNTGDNLLRSISFDEFGHVALISSYNPFTNTPAFNPSNGTPFTTNSGVLVTNLNADKVDGKHVGTGDGDIWLGSTITAQLSSYDNYGGFNVQVRTGNSGAVFTSTDINSADELKFYSTGPISLGSSGFQGSSNSIYINHDTITTDNFLQNTNPFYGSTTNVNQGYVSSITTDSYGHITQVLRANPFTSSYTNFESTPLFSNATKPFSVTSTAKVTNLNADQVDSYHVGLTNAYNDGELWPGQAIKAYVLANSISGHPSTGGIANVSNTGDTLLQSITFDAFGHVASISSYNPFANTPQFVAGGGVPFTSLSTVKVINLNADMVDSAHVGSGNDNIWLGSTITTALSDLQQAIQSQSDNYGYFKVKARDTDLTGSTVVDVTANVSSAQTLYFNTNDSPLKITTSLLNDASNEKQITFRHNEVNASENTQSLYPFTRISINGVYIGSTTNAGNGYLSAVEVDGYGHITKFAYANPFTSPYTNFAATPLFSNATKPFSVTSTAKVTNLNADQVDSYHVGLTNAYNDGELWPGQAIKAYVQANAGGGGGGPWYWWANATGNTYQVSPGDTLSFGAGNSGISVSGASGSVSISHADTSNATNTLNNGFTFINNINFDDYGHVTNYVSVNPFLSRVSFQYANAGSFTVANQYKVINLHADLLDGYHVNNTVYSGALWTADKIEERAQYWAQYHSQSGTQVKNWHLKVTDDGGGNGGYYYNTSHTIGTGSVINQATTLKFHGGDGIQLHPSLAADGYNITIEHADTSSMPSLLQATHFYISEVQLDTKGHVTYLRRSNPFSYRPTFTASGQPFYVNSTTTIPNLSADSVDGYHVVSMLHSQADSGLWTGADIKSYVASNSGGTSGTYDNYVRWFFSANNQLDHQVSSQKSLNIDTAGGLTASTFESGNNINLILSHTQRNNSQYGSSVTGGHDFYGPQGYTSGYVINKIRTDSYGHITGIDYKSLFNSTNTDNNKPYFFTSDSSAPFTVSSSSLVYNLNSQYVMGKSVDTILGSYSNNNLWTGQDIKNYVAANGGGGGGGGFSFNVNNGAFSVSDASPNIYFANGSLTSVSTYGSTVAINHATPATVANSTTNSGTNVINNLLFDSYGHVSYVSSANPFSSSPSFTAPTPFSVTSTTKVSNLNSDTVDGKHVGTSDGNLWDGTRIRQVINESLPSSSFTGGTVANTTTFNSTVHAKTYLTVGDTTSTESSILKVYNTNAGLYNAKFKSDSAPSTINLYASGVYDSRIDLQNYIGTWKIGNDGGGGGLIIKYSNVQRYKISGSDTHSFGNASTKVGSYFFSSTQNGSFQKQWYPAGSSVVDKIDYTKYFYNQPYIGNATATVLNASSVSSTWPSYHFKVNGTAQATAWYTASDERLKTDIQPIGSALSKITGLNGVQFKWQDNHDLDFVNYKGDKIQYGLIAQQAETVVPEIVNEASDTVKSIDYVSLVPILIESIKELKAEIDQLRAELGG